MMRSQPTRESVLKYRAATGKTTEKRLPANPARQRNRSLRIAVAGHEGRSNLLRGKSCRWNHHAERCSGRRRVGPHRWFHLVALEEERNRAWAGLGYTLRSS